MRFEFSINDLIERWCDDWNIDKPIIITDNEEPGFAYHEIRDNDSILAINTDSTDQQLLMYVVMHELRHHWQFIKYPDMYNWWLNHKDYYNRLYKSQLCIVEEDANIFSWTEGERNGEFLFQLLSVEDMRNIFKSLDFGTLISIEKNIQMLEIKHDVSQWKSMRREILKNKEYKYKFFL